MSSDDLSERQRAIAVPRSDNSAVVVRPASIEELSDALRDGSSAGGAVGISGGGSKQSWGGLGVEPTLIVDTTSLDRVVEHAEGDLVVTVQAGAPLGDLQQALAPAGQWLPLDPPEPAATVGGVVATAASGPRRLRFGTPRDLLIGVTVVLADGTVAKSGGKVVKNVAGYDLGKLFAGSYGTLGVIASCTFRLQPVARARRVVSIAADDPSSIAHSLARSTVVPAAVEWDGRAVHVVIETSPAAADSQARDVMRLARDGVVADELPAGFGERPWQPGEVAVKVTHQLSALGPVVAALRRELAGARLSAHVGSGVVWAGWPADGDAAAGAIAALRAEVAAYDGAVVVVDAPPHVKRALDVWGPVRGLEVMRRVKERFDPAGRTNRGRFVGGI
jgi:glycolate oxidase FAD binding subunit